VVCMRNENQVVIHDLETGEQKMIEIKVPRNCASSQHTLAVTTFEDGLRLFAHDSELVHVVPDSMDTECVAFHPDKANLLAIGYGDGTVRIWNALTRAYLSSFKEHADRITNVRFGPNCRLLMSSWDESASIVTLDDQFQVVSSVKLEGHSDWVNDIIPLPLSNQCVTCSDDKTIKVWDGEAGACLHTLTKHAHCVISLAMHPTRQFFASGSFDLSVIIWFSETF
jgi:WD40 repeat protein